MRRRLTTLSRRSKATAYKTSPSVARVDPVPAAGDRGPGVGEDVPPPWARQNFSASGTAQQAVQGSGIQNVYLGNRAQEPAVSVTPPLGQRDQGFPVRGRDSVLAELADIGVAPRVWVVHGLGGCGKTRLALEAAARAQDRGTEVWWVSAADTGAMVAGMRAVGRRLGLSQEDLEHGDAADLLWQRLIAKRDSWLLVIDNADDPQALAGAGTYVADGRGWLRPVTGQTGMVLVTSRDGSAASWGSWCHRHRLGMLPPDEATAVLADHSGRHPRLGRAHDAEMLAVRLGGLPLALKIAGSYLASTVAIPTAFTDAGTITTYDEYRKAMDAERAEAVFMQPGEQMTQVEARTLIGQTWQLTLDRLDARQLPEARQILRLLATFADGPVPYELLLNPSVLAASAVLRNVTGTRLWQAMTALDDFGLLEMSSVPPGSAEISVAQLHPLVRDTSCPDAGTAERRAFLKVAARLLEQAVISRVPEHPLSWPILQLLAPHVDQIFHDLTAEPGCPRSAAISVAHTMYLIARYRSAQGLRAQAEADYRDVLEAQLRTLGPDHRDTLATRFGIAQEMARRGNHAAAEDEYRAVLAAEMRILGPDNSLTLSTRHQLAHEVATRGDHATAEAEHRSVLEAALRTLGPDHATTLSTRHCLAHEIAARGDHATAEAEHRAVLEAELRIFGPDHPHVVITRRCLARDIAARGDHTAAEAELRDVLETHLRIFGPDHPSTLAARGDLAHEIAARGDHATAEAEYRAMLEAELRNFGPDHPSTLAARFAMAGEIAARGDHAAAEAELRDVLEAQQRILGPDNPSTLITRREMAGEIAVRGDHAAAEAELRDVLEAQQRILGPDNRSTLITRHQLADQIAARGDHAAAEAELRDVIEAASRTLGPDNLTTLSTRRCLAREVAVRGDHTAAEAEHRAVLEAQLRILGPDNPSTLITRHQVAHQIAARGDHTAAEAELRDVLEVQQRILGPDHPSTLDTRRCLAKEIARGEGLHAKLGECGTEFASDGRKFPGDSRDLEGSGFDPFGAMASDVARLPRTNG